MADASWTEAFSSSAAIFRGSSSKTFSNGANASPKRESRRSAEPKLNHIS
jgi:hypothetical protein